MIRHTKKKKAKASKQDKNSKKKKTVLIRLPETSKEDKEITGDCS